MSATGKDRTIEEQLSTLLDHNAPAVNIEAIRERTPATTLAKPMRNGKRMVGLRPALAWMFALLVLGALGIGIGVGVNGTATTKPTSLGGAERLSDHLVLDTTRGPSQGRASTARSSSTTPARLLTLPRVANLSWQSRLNRGNFHQQIAFPADCVNGPMLIDHGTTRLPVSVDTTFDVCVQSGPGTASFPKCLANGDAPPLAPGTYMAEVLWSGKVSLPTPKEVALTLVAEARAAPDVTQMKEFQPWATTTSLSSGIKVIGTLSGETAGPSRCRITTIRTRGDAWREASFTIHASLHPMLRMCGRWPAPRARLAGSI